MTNSTLTLRRKAFLLEYGTVAWNLVEAALAISTGLAAGSVALVAFGLDSLVEVFASAVVIWELLGVDDRRERFALKLIGLAYLAVSLYIGWEAIRSLVGQEHPGVSVVGMVLMLATVLIMLSLAYGKQKVGSAMVSATVLADARFSAIDAALAGSVLVGLGLNALFGLWWSDQVMALALAALAALAAREGTEALRG